jgi:ribosome biogenesis SPOUT family RNA methylase Rps3
VFDNIAMEKTELDVTGSANIGLEAANASASKEPEEINKDRFHLFLGIIMEALCSPRTGEMTTSQLSRV